MLFHSFNNYSMLTKRNLAFCRGLLIAAAFASAASTAHGLTINLNFDSSVASSFGANTISMTNAVTYAAQQFENNFSDNITLNFTVKAVPNTSLLSQSSAYLAVKTSDNSPVFSYSEVVAAFNNSQSTTNDAAAYSALPANDPSGGNPYLIPNAQAKALGIAVYDQPSDGTVTFGAGFNYAYDPNNRSVAGAYDIIGITEHEFSESMGRLFGLGRNIAGFNPSYLPYDLFRFNSAGTRDMTNGSGIYFSLDNGATNLRNYYFPNGGGSDPQDWSSDVPDAFNALAAPGAKLDMSAVDLAAMDVLGYHLNPSNSWTWAANANGNWSGSGSWINYGVPSGSSIQVVFNGAINAPRTITLDLSPTAGTLTFNNANSYTLSGAGTLTMSTTQGDAAIEVLRGTHSIWADVTLSSNTNMIVSGTSDLLTISGAITGPGALIKSGSGSLILSAPANSFSGGTTVLDGKLVVTNPGALADGSNLSVGANTWLFQGPIVPAATSPLSGAISPSSVPEPTTPAIILAAAVVGAGAFRLKHRRVATPN
jgi:autotransporter-associated beta strand protein